MYCINKEAATTPEQLKLTKQCQLYQLNVQKYLDIINKYFVNIKKTEISSSS